MKSTNQTQGFISFNIKPILSGLKNNLPCILWLAFLGLYFYQVHQASLKHASDKYIALSEALEQSIKDAHGL